MSHTPAETKVLAVQPVWPLNYAGHLTSEIIDVTNELHRICTSLSINRKVVAKQVREIRMNRNVLVLGRSPQKNEESIGAATGKAVDIVLRQLVEQAQKQGNLPKQLHVADKSGPGAKGPDFTLSRVAWEVTNAERGAEHVRRDVNALRWDVYFLLYY
jgi:hypothetical protein